MRNSPRRHVLVLIREELGWRQKDLLNFLKESLVVSRSAAQKIELGSLPLSRDTAQEMSKLFGVSVDCLMENDVSKPLRAVNGKRWTKKVHDEWRASLSEWAKLSSEAHALRLRNSELLLRGYLRHRSLVESFENPDDGADLLDSYLERALTKFIKQNRKLLKEHGPHEFRSKLDNDDNGLESVLWDVQEVLKAAKKLPPRSRTVRKKPLPRLIRNSTWKPLEPLTLELLRSDALAQVADLLEKQRTVQAGKIFQKAKASASLIRLR
jgi:transcriptional regulator with XRE-family HTH domain